MELVQSCLLFGCAVCAEHRADATDWHRLLAVSAFACCLLHGSDLGDALVLADSLFDKLGLTGFTACLLQTLWTVRAVSPGDDARC